MTTSLKVVEVFGKRHNHILRDIEKIKHDLPDDAQPIFGLSEYVDPTGRTLPMYQMSRDGFTLLAMGFTGVLANSERRGGDKGQIHFMMVIH
ncbi:Rha family transcriptional regulator [Pelobacter propionicus]|uniref:Uncharacterized phage-encoded protein-like protein n=1 Tax=Pelobacter propionicus (strain DSM 2379 / NBRC 103807 / OttBd1) TaxID=338966 RepID=A1ATQ4_PELPD|nr:Rha family transcriptional regulator [Pelobacter propionicus]ABL00725.1 Uncharacterized phage-encoded protein-like protein [Pelobacter propionicus DSM 2379]